MQAANLARHKRADFQRGMGAEGESDNVELSALRLLVDRLCDMPVVVGTADGTVDGEAIEAEDTQAVFSGWRIVDGTLMGRAGHPMEINHRFAFGVAIFAEVHFSFRAVGGLDLVSPAH